jgi:hypothetical protein
MPVGQTIPYSEGIFSITFTCFDWKPIFEITQSYDLVYKWFDHLKKNGHYIIGYTTMPNHLHSVIGFRYSTKSINKAVGDGKRFMAYEMVKRLEKMERTDILESMNDGVNQSDSKRGKKHEVWEESFDWKECDSEELIIEKLNYLHINPCKGKWNLVNDPADYPHSSAKFYMTGEQGIYPITHYMELHDIDLTRPLIHPAASHK